MHTSSSNCCHSACKPPPCPADSPPPMTLSAVPVASSSAPPSASFPAFSVSFPAFSSGVRGLLGGSEDSASDVTSSDTAPPSTCGCNPSICVSMGYRRTQPPDTALQPMKSIIEVKSIIEDALRSNVCLIRPCPSIHPHTQSHTHIWLHECIRA